MLIRQSLRNKLKALRSFRKKRNAQVCGGGGNRLTWAASQKRDTLHSSVLSCDKAIESVTEQIVEGWQLNDSALHISPPEQLVCPDLFLNEAHYLGNLRYRVWNDLGKITVFTSIILDPNTAATCVKVLLICSQCPICATRHPSHCRKGSSGRLESWPKASRKGPRPNSAQLFLLSRHGSHFLWNGDKKSAFVPREKADCITILYDGLRKMLSFTDRKSGFQLHVCSTKHITDQLFPFLAADESLKSQTKRIRLVSCLGVEPTVDGDDARFVLTSRNPDGSVVRFQLQTASVDTCKAWVNDVVQILETQRNFLNALQSPIEYQRRESKSNSLGRSMRPPLSATSSLRPHSSASIDRHKLPSLHSHNTSLPALYLPSQTQGSGLSDTFAVREPTLVQPCAADSHTVSLSHVQLGFTDQSSVQAVSNGLYTPNSQSAQQRAGESCRRGQLCDAGTNVSGPSAGRRPSNLAQLTEDEL
ncbi:hypothetical protein WMY93_011348 [Mugilogobius chulae]|uniref:PH domain-containing protein n=1 Tax=Mugilogobius chulae TaxID=88201 RepID=A0AAW0P5R6_9GOBI